MVFPENGESITAGRSLPDAEQRIGERKGKLMLQFGPNTELDRMAFGEEIVRLEALIEDLWHVSIHNHPSDKSTRDAPILENWKLAFRPSLCLIGAATGHPRLPGHQRPVVTSALWMLSARLGLGRTESRWYQLGKPADTVLMDS